MQHTFTTKFDKLTRVLYNKVEVGQPIPPEETKTQQVKLNAYLAIWDTGATNSAITKKVANDLGLEPTGVRNVRHAQGESLANTYLVNITLPSRVMVGQVRVTEVALIPDDNTSDDKQPQLLIGMDIIGLGDFAVTNFNGKTTMSFRIPSVKEIDFVPETEKSNMMQIGMNRHERRAFQTKKKRGLI